MSVITAAVWCLALLSLGGMAGAEIIHVPQDAPTIQAGLDSLNEGDTVLVSRGVYAEALVAPDFAFSLLGDVPVDTGDFERPIIDASLIPDTLRLWALRLPARSDATVERLRFRSHSIDGGVHFTARHARFRDCAFDSLGDAILQPNHAERAAVEIETCRFRSYISEVFLGYSAVHAQDCAFLGVEGIWNLLCGDSSLVENCTFIDAGVDAITTWGDHIIIRNCLFSSEFRWTVYPYVDLVDFSGVLEEDVFANLNLQAPTIDLKANCEADVIVRNNVFYDCNSVSNSGYACPLMYIHCDSLLSQPYVLSENVMHACTTWGYATGILAQGRGYFERNRLYDLVPSWDSTLPAIKLQSGDSMVFRENLFYHNGFAMDNWVVGVADARWNWWGDATGPSAETNPGGGDSVGANILFDPWYPDTSFLSVPGLGRPLPEEFIFEAYPNPFNSTVTLNLIPPEVMMVRVELFDVLGRKVQDIWSGPLAFQKQIIFDGGQLSSGIYFARVWQAIGNRPLALKKLMLLK